MKANVLHTATLIILYILKTPVKGAGQKRLVDEDDDLEPMYQTKKVLLLDDYQRSYRHPPCNEDRIATYLAELSAINPESIISSAAADEPEDVCIRQSVVLDSLDLYLKTCQRPTGNDLYMQLIKGVEAMYAHLCLNEIFKQRFQQSWPCIHEIEDEYQDCYGAEDWTENTDAKQVCSTYEEIANCFYIKTSKMCGTVSAQMMKQLTDKVIKAVIWADCKLPQARFKAEYRKDDGRARCSGGISVCCNFSKGAGQKRLVDEDDDLELMYQTKKKLLLDDYQKSYRHPPCNEDRIATYLAELSAINPESIISSAAADEPEDVCIRQSVVLDSLDLYLKTCQRPTGNDLYMQLIKGVEAMYAHLCLNEIFKQRFQQSWPCIHEIEDEYPDCYGAEDWTENTDAKQVYSTYEEIANCFYIKTAKMCGTVSAQMMKQLTDKVIKAVIWADCKLPQARFKAEYRKDDGRARCSGGISVCCNFSKGAGQKRLVDEDEDLEPMYQTKKKLLLDDYQGSYRHPPCNEDRIATYLAELSAINPESIISSAANTLRGNRFMFRCIIIGSN